MFAMAMTMFYSIAIVPLHAEQMRSLNLSNDHIMWTYQLFCIHHIGPDIRVSQAYHFYLLLF